MRYASAVVVEKRSYSRNSGSTSLESEHLDARQGLAKSSPTRSLVRRVEEREEEADGDRVHIGRAHGLEPPRRRPRRARAPRRPGPTRSRTVKRSSRGTSGSGGAASGRRARARSVGAISITSRKPSVVTSAVRAPRRSRSAFVATVVPWAKAAIEAPSMEISSSAAIAPADWSAGVERPWRPAILRRRARRDR